MQCSYCKKFGHTISNCYTLQRKNAALATQKPVAFTTSVFDANLDFNSPLKGSLSDIREEFLPFITKGFVTLSELSDSPKYPVTILRDTGSTQSLLLVGEAPLTEGSSLDTNVSIMGISNESFDVPLHRLCLQSDLVSGPITVGITPSLPRGLEGITLILGNDVAGTRVVVDPYMTDRPSTVDNTEKLEKEFPGMFPSCVTTRAMSRKAIETPSCNLSECTSNVDLEDTFMTKLDNESLSQSIDSEVKTSAPKVEGPSQVVHQLEASGDIFLDRE